MDPHAQLCRAPLLGAPSARRTAKCSARSTSTTASTAASTRRRGSATASPCPDLLAECDRDVKLVLVGDALMHPAELLADRRLVVVRGLDNDVARPRVAATAGAPLPQDGLAQPRARALLARHGADDRQRCSRCSGSRSTGSREAVRTSRADRRPLIAHAPSSSWRAMTSRDGQHEISTTTKTRRDRRDVARRRVPDPYRWLEDEHAARGPGVDDGARTTYARGALAKLPGARRARGADQGAVLLRRGQRAAPPRRPLLLHAQARRQREDDRLLEAGRDRRRAGAVRSERAGAPTAARASHGWWPSWDGKHVASTGQRAQLRRDRDARDRRRDGQGPPDVIDGTKYAGASWTPDGNGFYYTWVPPVVGERARSRSARASRELRFHTLGSDPAKDPIVARGDAECRDVPRRRHLARRPLAARASSSTAGTRRDIYFKDARKHGREVADARRGRRRELRRRRVARPASTSRPTTARRATACFASIRTKPERAALEGDRPRRATSTLESAQRRRRAPRADVPAQRGEPDRDPRPRRQARPRRRAARHRHRRGGISGEPDEDTGYFAFTSFTEPQLIFKTSIKTGKADEWARDQAAGRHVAGHDASRCGTRRRTAPRSRCSSSTARTCRRTARPDDPVRLRRLQRQR